jgi:hypothetical protein
MLDAKMEEGRRALTITDGGWIPPILLTPMVEEAGSGTCLFYVFFFSIRTIEHGPIVVVVLSKRMGTAPLYRPVTVRNYHPLNMCTIITIDRKS